ncbi:hypothetical protein [Parafrankia sp. CH37]|uniref:hypothetical protein n=1 Tax=Parafrankia sp. CH37 TaxID=683308 RepID=UPI001D0166A9|nr:hypothetical protein [Parafrankia sp. CH37]
MVQLVDDTDAVQVPIRFVLVTVTVPSAAVSVPLPTGREPRLFEVGTVMSSAALAGVSPAPDSTSVGRTSASHRRAGTRRVPTGRDPRPDRRLRTAHWYRGD